MGAPMANEANKSLSSFQTVVFLFSFNIGIRRGSYQVMSHPPLAIQWCKYVV